MTINSYDSIRTQFEIYNRVVDRIKRHHDGIIPDTEKNGLLEWKNEIKEGCRAFYRTYDRYHPDPLSVPIRNEKGGWRTVSDRDSDGKIFGDSCTDFIIIQDNGQTDDDIKEFVYSTVYCHSPYDFPTGRMVTYSWGFTRTRCGIAITHRRGIDW